jgi:hypothetical protein
MNFAFGAIIVFLLLAPGISFRFLYLRSDSLRSNLDSSAVSEVFFIVLVSSIIHPAALSLLWKSGFSPDISQLYLIISGAKGNDGLQLSLINESVNYFLSYIFLLCVVSGILGQLAQSLVLRFDLDLKYPVLSVSNEWDTLFSGRKLDKRVRENIEYIQIDALVSTSEGDVVYCGILKHYILNKNGLDKIYLCQIFRRKLKDDRINTAPSDDDSQSVSSSAQAVTPALDFKGKAEDDRYYNMPGDYLVIPYQYIRNINITYYSGEEVEKKS